MNKVYVIVREEGFYSDYGMEVVKAVASEQVAKDFVQNANISEQIKMDRCQEIRDCIIQWNKENPCPTHPIGISYESEEFSKWKQEFWAPHNKKREKYEDGIENKLIETYRDQYKDFKFLEHQARKDYFSNVTYSYQEMDVEQ